MPTVTLDQPTAAIFEALSSSSGVDAEKGVVRNVKLIGFQSKLHIIRVENATTWRHVG